jgi:hypothetical protein
MSSIKNMIVIVLHSNNRNREDSLYLNKSWNSLVYSSDTYRKLPSWETLKEQDKRQV